MCSDSLCQMKAQRFSSASVRQDSPPLAPSTPVGITNDFNHRQLSYSTPLFVAYSIPYSPLPTVLGLLLTLYPSNPIPYSHAGNANAKEETDNIKIDHGGSTPVYRTASDIEVLEKSQRTEIVACTTQPHSIPVGEPTGDPARDPKPKPAHVDHSSAQKLRGP